MEHQQIKEYMDKFKIQKQKYIDYLNSCNKHEQAEEQIENIKNIEKFINNLEDIDVEALIIAIEHLEDSFDIEKSIYYLKKK